jgi:hypothetical protein
MKLTSLAGLFLKVIDRDRYNNCRKLLKDFPLVPPTTIIDNWCFIFLEEITNEEVTRIRCNVSYRFGRLR